jgi:hypothetical protein
MFCRSTPQPDLPTGRQASCSDHRERIFRRCRQPDGKPLGRAHQTRILLKVAKRSQSLEGVWVELGRPCITQ